MPPLLCFFAQNFFRNRRKRTHVPPRRRISWTSWPNANGKVLITTALRPVRRRPTMTNEESPLKNFELFVRMAFRGENDGQELGHEPYIPFVCHRIKAAENDGARIVVNMPPRHLKTSVGTVFLSAWL